MTVVQTAPQHFLCVLYGWVSYSFVCWKVVCNLISGYLSIFFSWCTILSMKKFSEVMKMFLDLLIWLVPYWPLQNGYCHAYLWGKLYGHGKVLTVGCVQGFVARPESGVDGALNLMIWQCTLPGKAGVCNLCHIPLVSSVFLHLMFSQ